MLVGPRHDTLALGFALESDPPVGTQRNRKLTAESALSSPVPHGCKVDELTLPGGEGATAPEPVHGGGGGAMPPLAASRDARSCNVWTHGGHAVCIRARAGMEEKR